MSEFAIEKRLTESLCRELGTGEGERLCRRYKHAKEKICVDVLPYIQGIEPNLTDHSGRHIENVLSNACRLIEDEQIDAINLYLLCQGILFHDAGNVRGRKDHHKRVGEAYDYAYEGSDKDPQERRLVTRIAAAHTGTAADGSTDTLQELGETDQYLGRVVRFRDIAAILRFADELAEGPQRTSTFAIEHGLIDDASRLFHVYAQATRVTIDKRNNRVALDYYIDVRDNDDHLQVAANVTLSDILRFIYARLAKLDVERKYARHYCQWLAQLKLIDVRLHLSCNDYTIPVKSVTLQMTDLILPDAPSADLESRYPELIIKKLEEIIRKCLRGEHGNA